MTIEWLKLFFMWCTVINFVLLVFSSLVLVVAGGVVYRIHSKFFAIQRETFNAIVYSFLGVYKLLWICLNLVPYIALLIMLR